MKNDYTYLSDYWEQSGRSLLTNAMKKPFQLSKRETSNTSRWKNVTMLERCMTSTLQEAIQRGIDFTISNAQDWDELCRRLGRGQKDKRSWTYLKVMTESEFLLRVSRIKSQLTD